MRKMKTIVVSMLAMIAALSTFAGCGEPHDDGICDHQKCDAALTVVRYEKEVELCLIHAIEKYGEEFVNNFKD